MNWDEYWGMNAPSYYGDMQGRPLTQQEYLAQQQMYNQQMYNQQMANQQFRNPTKKEIMDCLIASTGANEVIKVDEFETLQTRHICQGTHCIQVLQKSIFPVQMAGGTLGVEYFFCPNCRKLIVNKSSMDYV